MKTRWTGLVAAAAALGVLAGCGSSSDGGKIGGGSLRGIYTVNGGGGMAVDGTASFVDTAKSNEVTARAFDVGKAPNHMVISGSEAYVVNSVSNNVQIVDLRTGTTVGTVSTGAGANPMKLAVAPTGLAYVTNLVGNSVAVIDLAGRTLTATIDLSSYGSGPTGVAVASNKVYVTLTSMNYDGQNVTYGQGKVVVIPVGATQASTSIDVPTNPQDAVVDAAGRVHVACTGDYGASPGRIAVIDPTSDTVASTVAIGGTPGNLTVAGTRVFVADASYGVTAYEANTGSVVVAPAQAITQTGSMLLDVRYDPQTQLVYAADFMNDRLLVIDPVTTSITGTITVGDGPTSIGVFPS